MHFGVIFAITGGFIYVAAASCPYEDKSLQKWSESNTWNNGFPGPGDTVTIDTAVLLDVTDVTVTQIHIIGEGSLVVLDKKKEQDRVVTITADGILIKDTGALIIGSEDCRFQNKVDIRLTGTRTADRSLVDAETGEKFIGIMDEGELQIYGQEKLGWTRLTQTVFPLTDAEESNVVYSHGDSKLYAEKDRYNNGLAMYTFYDCNLQPKSYRVYDLDQGGITKNEQATVQEMIDALDDVEEKQIVAIAKQKGFETTADLTALYTKLEEMTGISEIGLREAYEFDAYALVFQKGGEANEALKQMLGTDELTARAFIVVKHEKQDQKVTAISKIKLQDSYRSGIDFRILSTEIGFPTIKVDDDVSSWKPGDEIIVTTTDFSPKHTEVMVIREIVSARMVRLQDEFEYRHFGKIENGVDMRAEVGLLTRNILIRGVMERSCNPDTNENCGEFSHDTYGGHIKAIHGFGSIHIEGAELKNMGQDKHIGFYPIHFHLCLDVSDKEAVVKSNSIHNTYLRCVTIHGTWGQDETQTGVKVLGNVAYDILGTCYFTEDGPEKYTVIDGNLAALIKKVDNGFEADKASPTGFWITNPVIKLVNNVVAGSEGHGIWYVFPEEPVGPSEGIIPPVYERGEAFRTPIWMCDNNKVHSVEKDGIRFDNILRDDRGKVNGRMFYRPLADPKNESSEVVTTYIVRFTSYKNLRRNAWFMVAGKFILIQYSSAESRRGLQSARSRYNLFVKKSIFVGRSMENYEDDVDIKHRYGIVHYETPIFIFKTWFNGFETTDKYVGGALGFQPNKRMSGPFSSNTTDIRFGGVDKVDGTGVNRVFNGITYAGQFGINGQTHPTASFRNADSSMLTCQAIFCGRTARFVLDQVGNPENRLSHNEAHLGVDMKMRQVLMPYSYIATDKCRFRENWNAIACEYNYGMIQIGGTGSDTVQAKRSKLGETDVAYEDHTAKPSTAFTVALGTSKYYYLFQFTEGIPNTVTFSGKGVERYEPVVIGLCLPDGVGRDQVELRGSKPASIVTRDDEWQAADKLDEVFNDETMTRYYLEDRKLYVRLSSNLERDLDWEKYDTAYCPSNKCPSLTVKLPAGIEYTPSSCFTIPEGEQNKLMTSETMGNLTCDLPASEPENDWGAGDTSRDVIRGSWGEWSTWSYCCGATKTSRHRVCDNPPPKGDVTCQGRSSMTQNCPIGCPANGEWGPWSKWSDCFCDGIAVGSSGGRTRTRACENVAHLGDLCEGPYKDSESCNGGCQ